MIVKFFDPEIMGLTVGCGPEEIGELPGYIASLIIVAEECGIRQVIVEHPECISPQIFDAAKTLAERNPMITLRETGGGDEDHDDFGFCVISRTDGFLFLRDAENEWLYSIFISADYKRVDLASRLGYLIANIMGFSGSTAFDVRFGVYEILMNVIDHGNKDPEKSWVRVQIEKSGHKLMISIVDESGEFDPTDEHEFNLENYITSRKRRGLGLLLMNRMHESLQYERKNGFNRVFFDRTMPSGIERERENGMSSMEVGEFIDLGNGITKIDLNGDLDAKGALALEKLLGELLDRRILRVALDFENVPFVSSAGIGMLLGTTSTIRDEGGEVWFTRVSKNVASVFELLNLDDFFLVMETEESIIQA